MGAGDVYFGGFGDGGVDGGLEDGVERGKFRTFFLPGNESLGCGWMRGWMDIDVVEVRWDGMMQLVLG